MIGNLYISTVDYKWNNNTRLINQQNYSKIINSPEIINCHTSPEDLSITILEEIFTNADDIYLVEYDQSSGNDYWYYGYVANKLYKFKHKVHNFEWISNINYKKLNANEMKPRPSTDKTVMWSFGCSHTYGCGLEDPINQRWSNLLSNKLGIVDVNQAVIGSSLGFSADRIIRSDIRKGDIVLWGLTNFSRYEYGIGWKYASASISQYLNMKEELRTVTPAFFSSETPVVLGIHYILQVINYCERIGAKLYLINVGEETWTNVVFCDYTGLIDLTVDIDSAGRSKFIDYALDNDHPGPKQHQHYADVIFKFLSESNNGKTI